MKKRMKVADNKSITAMSLLVVGTFLVLLHTKLSGTLDAGWIWVFAPLWLPYAALAVFAGIGLGIAGIAAIGPAARAQREARRVSRSLWEQRLRNELNPRLEAGGDPKTHRDVTDPTDPNWS